MEIQLAVQSNDEKEVTKIKEIFTALIACGGLTGVKGGKTILHFDTDGNFKGIELDYWPWKKRD